MSDLSAALKERARALGFHLVGITTPEPFERAEQDMLSWLEEGHQGEMAWLNAARAHLACRPDELLPGARSLVVVGVVYRTDEPSLDGPSGKVARYAWGSDYHDELKTRLRALAQFLETAVARAVRTRVFVDSGPLAERDAAVRAGLGFRGKNTNLLTPLGSYVFLGALLTDVELAVDEPVARSCGACRACIDACPTDALATPYHLAAERCISYLTIEHRGPIPEELREPMGDWIFGCDICQEVCPYNASVRRRERGWEAFAPRPRPGLEGLLALDDEGFRETFRGSPVKRAKRRGLARNAAIALGNRGDPGSRDALVRAAETDPEPLVREAATWALERVTSPGESSSRSRATAAHANPPRSER